MSPMVAAILLACKTSNVRPTRLAEAVLRADVAELEAASEESRRRVGFALSNLPRRHGQR